MFHYPFCLDYSGTSVNGTPLNRGVPSIEVIITKLMRAFGRPVPREVSLGDDDDDDDDDDDESINLIKQDKITEKLLQSCLIEVFS